VPTLQEAGSVSITTYRSVTYEYDIPAAGARQQLRFCAFYFQSYIFVAILLCFSQSGFSLSSEDPLEVPRQPGTENDGRPPSPRHSLMLSR
jgi:hypothetical protein